MPYKPKIITVRMSDEEHAKFKLAAENSNMSLNQWSLLAMNLAEASVILPPEKLDCKGDNNVPTSRN